MKSTTNTPHYAPVQIAVALHAPKAPVDHVACSQCGHAGTWTYHAQPDWYVCTCGNRALGEDMLVARARQFESERGRGREST